MKKGAEIVKRIEVIIVSSPLNQFLFLFLVLTAGEIEGATSGWLSRSNKSAVSLSVSFVFNRSRVRESSPVMSKELL